MDKYIGRLLDNRYEILEVIGTGGMAVVYKARCHRLNRLVAIKILKDDNLEDEDFRRRFHAESQAVAMLSHPNIVSVYDVSTSLMADYIVMELIEGITLKQYMEKKGVLNWKETLHFAIQIAKALEHAHSRGIVHRDIKPHNVMVLKNGSVKVTDFGIARMMSKGNTLTKEALGSVHYISPEQARGGRVDNRSDIYSLGVVMYEMMSGRPPYDGDSPVSVAIQHINGGAVMPSTLNPNIPGGLEQIIMKAMAHELSDRYSSATRMLSDMDEFRKDPTILFDYHTPPTDAVTRMPQPSLVLQPDRTTAQRVVQREEQGIRRQGGGQNTRPPASRTTRPTDSDRMERTSGNSGRLERPNDTRQESRRRQQEERESRGSRVATIAIISCSLVAVIAVIIFFVTLVNGGLFSKQPEMIEVPRLVGEKYESLTPVEGLEIIKEVAYDETIPEGIIINQNPASGSVIAKPNVVVVTVSLGPTPQVVKMGNLVDMTQDQATDLLDSLEMGLQLQYEEEYNETVAAGSVIRTDPEKDVELTAGQTITLWISKGPEIKTGTIPNVVGETAEVAKRILDSQELKLQISTEEVFDSLMVAGQVVRTEPEVGSQIQTGQAIKLYISKGPETVKIPNVVGMDIEKAVKMLISCGFATPTIEYVDSDEDKDIVVSQSEEKNTQVDINKEIILEISKGKDDTPVVMDVVLDLRGSAQKAACRVQIRRDGELIYDETVKKKTAAVTLKEQSGLGPVKYEIIINEQDGWEEWVDFGASE